MLGGDPEQTPAAATPRTPSLWHSTKWRRRWPDPPQAYKSSTKTAVECTSFHIPTTPYCLFLPFFYFYFFAMFFFGIFFICIKRNWFLKKKRKKRMINKVDERREEGQLRTPNPNNRNPTRLHSSWELQELQYFPSFSLPSFLSMNK